MALTLTRERGKRIEKARTEEYAEGCAEGRAGVYAEERAKACAEWSDWNRRREEAARRGERFNEPHPRLDDAAR